MAYFGVKLGMQSKDTYEPVHSTADDDLTSGLTNGVIFPDVALLDSNDSTVSSQSLLADQGGVVMFVDLNCPPCHEMGEKLQKAFTTELSDVSVIGISYARPQEILSYRKAEMITFPIYADTSLVFVQKYMVQNYPLLVIVGKSGVIRDYTFDARLPIDAAKIRTLIAE